MQASIAHRGLASLPRPEALGLGAGVDPGGRGAEAREPVELFGRYRIERLLGQGASARVYAAADLRTGQAVAVKLVGPFARDEERLEALVRFRREARVLTRLDHPAIVRVLDWGELEDGAYIAMERLRGEPLTRRLERLGRLTDEEAAALGLALAGALAHAHEQGVCHRDVKPDNVVLAADDDPRATAKLLDFGLADLAHDPARRDAAGTYAYMAPEQIGVLDRPLDGRADLYGLGVLLYQALSGRLPFEADTLRRLIYLHLAKRPAPLRDLAPGARPGLAAIVEKLLEKDPDDRYQSAQGLYQDLARLDLVDAEHRARGRAALDPVGAGARARVRGRAPLIGREAELARVAAAIEASRSGHGRVLLVAGPPQSGKRRVLEAARDAALVRDATVLAGRAAGRASEPFAAVLGAVRAHLAGLARTAPERLDRLARVVASLLEGWGEPVLAALPELRARSALPAARALGGPASEPRVEQRRMVEALVRLLVELGRAHPPLVLLLDDLHASDEETALLVERLARRGDDHGLVVVARVDLHAPGAARRLVEHAREEQGSSSGERFSRLEVVRLGPLAPVAARELACALLAPLGEPSDAVLDRVLEDGDALPGSIEIAARDLVDRGAITVEGAERPLDERRLVLDEAADPRPGGRVDGVGRGAGGPLELVEATLARLGADREERIAWARLAALRRPFGLDTAAAALDLDDEATLGLIDRGVACGALARAPEVAGFRFASDRLRARLADRLGPERPAVAARVARHLASLPPAHPEHAAGEVAHHLIEAGDHAAALPCLVAAGQSAAAAHAYGSARQSFEQAVALLGRVGPGDAVEPLAFAALTGLGQSLFALGRYAEARRAFERAAERRHAPDDLERVRLETRLGATAFRLGDGAAAERHLTRALAALGGSGAPRWRALTRLGLAAAFARRAAAAVGAGGWRRGPLDDAARERLHATRELEYALFFVDTERAFLVHLAGLRAAEAHEPSPELGLLSATHAFGCGLLGWFGRARRFLARALEIGRALGCEPVLGEAHKFLAVIAYWSGDYAHCLERVANAEAIYDRRYDPFSLSLARTYRGLACYQQGALDDALAAFEAIQASGADSSDERGVGVGYLGRALVGSERGPIDEALRLVRRAVEVFERIRDNVFLGLALSVEGDLLVRGARLGALLGARGASAEGQAAGPGGAIARAVVTLERAAAVFREHRASGDYAALTSAALAEALAAEPDGDASEPAQVHARRGRLARARRAARAAIRMARRFPNGLARALRALARVEAAAGRPARALAALDEAAAAARRLGQRPAEAWAELERGALLLATAPREAVRRLESAEAGFAACGATLGAQLARRLLGAGAGGAAESGDPSSTSGSGATGGGDPRAQLRKLESLIEVGETLIAAQDLDALFAGVVGTAMEVTGAERGAVLLAEDGPEGRRFVARVTRTAEGLAGAGGAGAAWLEESPLLCSQAVLGLLVASGQPVCLPDAERDPRLEGHPSVAAQSLRSVLCVALRADNQMLGAIYLDSRLMKGLFGERDVRLLNTFAAQAALAITRARSRHALEQANRDLKETRAELVQSAKMSAIGELAAGLSHEIKNPLNIIGGYAYMLRELLRDHPHPKIASYLADIDHEIARAVGLIDNLLGFARPSDEPLQPIRVSDACERSASLLGELARTRGVTIALELEPDLPLVPGSVGQLQQVVVNLLLNAVQAMDADEGRITVRARLRGDQVLVEVEDTGRGMTPEQQSRIFEPFFTTRAEGTGLGLYVCYRILERFGGAIEVDSAPGRGSTFRLVLPLGASRP